MLKTIYLIRHGETDWNKEGRLQGWEDTHINKNGVHQAERVARWFKDKHVDSIHSSDLARCWETSAFIEKEKNILSTKTHLLRGRSFGKITGATREELKARRPDIHAQLAAENEVRWTQMGVETLISLTERMRRFFNTIKAEEEEFCVITHGAIIRQALRFFTLIPHGERPDLPHGCIVIISHNQGSFSHQIIDKP